ncbi:MAG: c-type cytochrome [Steroidobacteraceae bacterium]
MRTIYPALILTILGALTANTVHSVEPAPNDNDAALRRGKLLFITQCRACHRTDSIADEHKIGPHLAAIIDRKAATVPGYNYSAGLRAADWNWTMEKLDAWLQHPSEVVPGTTMTFMGIPGADDRQSLLLYLERETRPQTTARE